MKIKTKRSKRKLGLPAAILLCSLFFLAGLYSSTFISHDVPVIRPRLRMLEVAEVDHDAMPHGDTGEAFIESIPFQVLSWNPRALYFPNFATPEQCESIITMAKSKLKPSTLALRKGETCNSLGSSMAIDEQTEEEMKKSSLMALGAKLAGDEEGDELSKSLTALKGRDEDEMKADGKGASSARLSAEKKESVNVDGRDEEGQNLRGRLERSDVAETPGNPSNKETVSSSEEQLSRPSAIQMQYKYRKDVCNTNPNYS